MFLDVNLVWFIQALCGVTIFACHTCYNLFKEILKKFSSSLFAHNTINSDYIVIDGVRDHIVGVVFGYSF